MEKISTVKVIVCYHRKSSLVENSVYVPVHVGKENSQVSLGIQGDNEGDNISDRNCLYCELTGLYWAWKNLQADYIGLAHYRRLFSFTSMRDQMKSFAGWLRYGIYRVIYGLLRACENIMFYPLSVSINSEDKLKENIDDFERTITTYISKHPNIKIFALHPVRIGNLTNFYFFSMAGGREHIRIIREIVKRDYQEIYPYLEKTLKQNKLYYANMSIMSREVFDDYCSFLFDVLDKHYNRCLNEGYYHSKNDKGWARLSGYMGEYLTSTFISYYIENHRNSFKKLSMVKIEF